MLRHFHGLSLYISGDKSSGGYISFSEFMSLAVHNGHFRVPLLLILFIDEMRPLMDVLVS